MSFLLIRFNDRFVNSIYFTSTARYPMLLLRKFRTANADSQFGGASTYGFMSIEQRRQAWKELEENGRFDGPFYVRSDGKREWGLNAIWQHVFGVKLKYPHPRYRKVIVADPRHFNWLRLKGAPGVDHKFMGSFSERGVWIEMVRLHGEASWSSLDESAQRLFVVLSGEGAAGGSR